MKLYQEFESELEALKVALLLEEYRIPYQQEEERIELPLKYHDKFRKIQLEEELRQQNWVFHSRYESKTLLQNMTSLLEHHQIPYQTLEHKNAAAEVYIALNEMSTYYTLSLMARDFDRVHKILKEEAKHQSIYKQEDYYLRGLSDQELIDILESPNDWHVMDVVGAQYLLDERGVRYSDEDLELMRLHKMVELRRPQTVNRSKIILGYLLAFFVGILGIFRGLYYLQDQTILPNGRRVFTFDGSTRQHGWRIVLISLVWLLGVAISLSYGGWL